jgi:hypothetical protein
MGKEQVAVLIIVVDVYWAGANVTIHPNGRSCCAGVLGWEREAKEEMSYVPGSSG